MSIWEIYEAEKKNIAREAVDSSDYAERLAKLVRRLKL